MNKTIEQMLKKHESETIFDKKNSIKEIMQEIVLCGLSRAGFFKCAAFYGGTALRIFYGLDRFSEDLDFSLITPDSNFDFNDFIPILEKEIASYGLNFKIEAKIKSKDSDIKSAFLKGNTREHILLFFSDEQTARSVSNNDVIKIKFEVDINPPDFASFEKKYQLIPIPYEITLYDMPSLFAGKIHAVICRSWNNRIKGRDLYDYIFYIANNTTVNLKHLSARLAQTGVILDTDNFTIEMLRNMLCERFDNIDFEGAKQDVLPFIKNPSVMDVWSSDFFKEITKNLK